MSAASRAIQSFVPHPIALSAFLARQQQPVLIQPDCVHGPTYTQPGVRSSTWARVRSLAFQREGSDPGPGGRPDARLSVCWTMNTIGLDEDGLLLTCQKCGQSNRMGYERLDSA